MERHLDEKGWNGNPQIFKESLHRHLKPWQSKSSCKPIPSQELKGQLNRLGWTDLNMLMIGNDGPSAALSAEGDADVDRALRRIGQGHHLIAGATTTWPIGTDATHQ